MGWMRRKAWRNKLWMLAAVVDCEFSASIIYRVVDALAMRKVSIFPIAIMPPLEVTPCLRLAWV